ncbi:hypothetical protein CHS0354_038577, partial [Potamilus streckersoni]
IMCPHFDELRRVLKHYDVKGDPPRERQFLRTAEFDLTPVHLVIIKVNKLIKFHGLDIPNIEDLTEYEDIAI